MISCLRRFFFVFFLMFAAVVGRAQPTVPTTTGTSSSVAMTVGATGTVDLGALITVPGVTGQVVQFDTVLGKWNAEILATAAPVNAANFFRYVNAESYTNTIVHRSVPGFVIQGGGYVAAVPLTAVATPTSARLEYNLPNTRGTLAMARGADVNSATSQWFVNLVDNSTTLNQSNGGGYTVFGRVLGTGMTVVDAIASVPLYNIGFDSVGASTPLRNVQSGQTTVQVSNYIVVNSVKNLPVYASQAGEAALVNFTATSANPAVAVPSVAGRTLTLTALAAGSTTVTVRGEDVQGNAAQTLVLVTVAGGAPVITAQPIDGVIVAGQTLALNVAATGAAVSYQWKSISGGAIPGATGPQLVVPNVTTADSGIYYCTVSNAAGSLDSAGAIIAVRATGAARLSNLSVRANLEVGQLMIVGFSTNGKKDLLVRGVGPKLATFGLANFFADPRLEIYDGAGVLGATNDTWAETLKPTFDALGAFQLDVGSKDAALVTPVNGGATAQLKGTGSGFVLVEVYDAGGGFTPRLTNLSALNRVGTGGDVLIAGFNIDGAMAKTVLVRGVGPRLAGLGVAGALADPKLEVFRGTAKLAENDDWNGAVGAYFGGLGAFALEAGSKDAALLITLPPGGYTVQLSGVGGTTGTGLIEVYELP